MIEIHITITADEKLKVKQTTTEYESSTNIEKLVAAGIENIIGFYVRVAAGLTLQETVEATHD